jgi:hypothetical protein
MSKQEGVEFFTVPNTLKSKVKITADGVDEAVLERAEQIIVELKDDYLTWAEDDITRLHQAAANLKELSAASPDDALVKKTFHDIYEVSHDMRGQGGSFGYPLMTAVCDRMCQFIEKVWDEPKLNQLPVLSVCIDTMSLIISQRLDGDGGAMGHNLLRALDAAIAKTYRHIEIHG